MKKTFAVLLISTIFLVLAAAFAGTSPAGQANPTATPTLAPPYNLTILHTNDIHANHEPGSNGDGGTARAVNVINQVRKEAPNTLLLNAGDNFTGTLFYYAHHGKDSVLLMNDIRYDAMTLGNHEFDEGNKNLATFISSLRFPVVSANIDFSQAPDLVNKVKPYVILDKGKQKIGIIGLIDPETPIMSSPGKDLTFNSDLVGVVQKYTDELVGKGVNKIILLSHVGSAADTELASKLKGVDIIVGGHSHTLFTNRYSGSDGPYPIVTKGADEKPVLLVQAGEKLQFLGRLDVVFDANGDLTSWGGDTILLSRFITPDLRTNSLIASLKAPIDRLTRQKVGEAAVYLEGERTVCRVKECNLGNLITDAMRKETGTQIAMINSGGIRASIQKGPVTLGDVIKVQPFGNLISTLKLKGQDLLAVLENGVSRAELQEGAGRFLQVSGMRFTYDPSKAAGSRVVSAEVWDEKSNAYLALDPASEYSLTVNDFMRGGGDGFTTLADSAIDPYDFGRPIEVVLANYITANSPVKAEVEGRITSK